MNAPAYDLRSVDLDDVRPLIAEHHGYGGVGDVAVHAFAVYEGARIVAAYVWNVPAPGAAKSASPLAPFGVLALTRMVAVPRDERALRHVSTPLRRMMRSEIDRTRWPVLITFHDHGQGHTGHVYKCSGWKRCGTTRAKVYTDESGVRRSRYANGRTVSARHGCTGSTLLTRWEHRVVPPGAEAAHMAAHGWVREPIHGKFWKSGAQAHRIVRSTPPHGETGW